MSAYITLVTPMLDEECLVAAVEEQGFARADLVQSSKPIALRGWEQGYVANIVLPKERTGDAYNDIGFLSTPMGYKAILSDDHAHFGSEWLSKVGDSYKTHWIVKQDRLAEDERKRIEEERKRLVEAQRQAVYGRAKDMGYRVKETREGDTLRMVLVKRTY